jgi:hypothetical protein
VPELFDRLIGTGDNNGVKSENEAGQRNDDGPAHQQTIFHKQKINKEDNEKTQLMSWQTFSHIGVFNRGFYRDNRQNAG